jgi:hypothetical protein
MTEVTTEAITLEYKKPKEKEPTIIHLPFSKIKKTVVQIIF